VSRLRFELSASKREVRRVAATVALSVSVRVATRLETDTAARLQTRNREVLDSDLDWNTCHLD
jgi:hypothetical protein